MTNNVWKLIPDEKYTIVWTQTCFRFMLGFFNYQDGSQRRTNFNVEPYDYELKGWGFFFG